jgi:hypothetical protein
VSRLPRDVLIRCQGDTWSIQEHAGHLLDLGSLDLARLDDYAAGRLSLTTAKPTRHITTPARSTTFWLRSGTNGSR